MQIAPLFCLLSLAASLTAQNTVVSPAGLGSVEGIANNVFPFGQATARRYMQIHADLGPVPLVITKLTFRVNASTSNFTGTRTHDLEVYMGDALPSAQAVPSFTFDNNYIAPKTTVLPRTTVTWGPTGQASSPGPNPFQPELELVLATPYVYTGAFPLIWEVAYFGSTLVGTMSAYDADSSTTLTATSTVTGTGCAPTGSATLMTHTYVINDTAGTLLMNGTITAAPANALAIMALGFTNPNLVVPGLCSPVYTDAAITQVLGFTSATGTFTADTPTGALVLPNVLTGLPLFTQAFAIDAASTASIPFTCSNGRTAVVPAPGVARINRVTRLWNTAGGTAATSAFFATSTVGYGLVVEFTHL